MIGYGESKWRLTMGAYLDLDDVAAGNPVAMKELRELREAAARLEPPCRKCGIQKYGYCFGCEHCEVK